MRRVLTLALAATLTAGGAAGCADEPGDRGKLRVVAAFYPMQFLAERIGGDRAEVVNLVKPGAEPHDMELTPSQVASVADADLVVYLRGFQPALDEAVDAQAKDKAFDAAAVDPLAPAPPGEDEMESDPHIWLDPVRFAAVGDKLAERFGSVDPDSADGHRSRAARLRADLTTLDGEYTRGLATCQRRDLVTSHAAFGYLAARYQLNQIAITGLSPEEEATPQRLAEVARLVRDRGVRAIFFESLVSPKVAKTLATATGAEALMLDPIEGLPEGSTDDYLSVMRKNLATIRPPLGCG